MYAQIRAILVFVFACVLLLPANSWAQVASVEGIALAEKRGDTLDSTHVDQGTHYSTNLDDIDVIKTEAALFKADIMRLYEDIVVHVGFDESKTYLRPDSASKEGVCEME